MKFDVRKVNSDDVLSWFRRYYDICGESLFMNKIEFKVGGKKYIICNFGNIFDYIWIEVDKDRIFSKYMEDDGGREEEWKVWGEEINDIFGY